MSKRRNVHVPTNDHSGTMKSVLDSGVSIEGDAFLKLELGSDRYGNYHDKQKAKVTLPSFSIQGRKP